MSPWITCFGKDFAFYIMSKNTIKTFAVLPRLLLEDLNKINFTKAEKNHALKFLDGLMKRSYREFKMIDEFVETPMNYFRKSFTTQYLKWLNKLINSNIITVDNSYSNIYNYSKSYSINKTYTSPPIMSLLFDRNSLKSVAYEFKVKNKTKEDLEIYNNVYKDLNILDVDEESLLGILDEELNKINIENYKFNEDILSENVNVNFGKNRRYWMTKEKAILKSKEIGKTLIEDGNKHYILTKEEFIIRKKNAVSQSYKDSISKLSNKKIYANRNITNNRLDTNITNMPKCITDKICKDNNLIQFDLCNAQFAILSDFLEDSLFTADFNTFKDQAYNGTLYEFLMESLNIKERKRAKVMMFELMFSKENFNSNLKKQLKTIFPSVVEIVDRYKKENGYDKFSIMLQKRESEIFIDGIWKKLKSKNKFCITKHDALIVKQKDKDFVEELIKSHFEKIGFKGKIIQE